jgi:hypothetical protein
MSGSLAEFNCDIERRHEPALGFKKSGKLATNHGNVGALDVLE